MQKTGAVINFPKTAKTTITLNFDLLDSKTWTLVTQDAPLAKVWWKFKYQHMPHINACMEAWADDMPMQCF